jgi:inosine/xanthosine triphosphate pyrophosphatase family protein
VFVDPRTGRTAAELGATAKNRVSHRGRALRALADGLRARQQAGAAPGRG